MDVTVVFVLPLIGGYCFAYLWHGISFGTKRAEGNHLYFRAAVCGAMLYVSALYARKEICSLFLACLNLDSVLVEYVRPALRVENGLQLATQKLRAEWVVTAAYSLVLGICGAISANRFTPTPWALRRGFGTLDRLLLRSYLEGKSVSLTLRTGKVYVGRVAKCPNPLREPAAVTLFPRFSGNRDATGQMILTTDYDAVFSAFDEGRSAQRELPADWRSQIDLQIRTDEIVTAAIFLPTIFKEFNPNWRQQLSPRNQVLASMGTNLRFSGPM